MQRSQQQRDVNGEIEDGDGETQDGADAMAALERQARAPVGFVAASSGPEGGNRPPDQTVVASNPDALNIEMDED